MTALTPGTFVARATSAASGKSSTGNDQVAIKFRVIQGPCEGEEITWFGSLSPKAREFTIKTIALAGLDNNLNHRFPATPPVVKLVLENNTWEGKTSLRVRYVNHPLHEGGDFKFKNELDESEKKMLAADIKDDLKIEIAKFGEPVFNAPPVTLKQPDEDDIPF